MPSEIRQAWKETLVSPKTTIRKTIETIDRGAMQVALVVDARQRLLGTVTDGDVRRGILRGVSLDAAVSLIMKKDPVSAQASEKIETLMALMRQKMIHQIPLVDSVGRVVGIEFLDELLATKEKDNVVILMAGGMGTRLRPLTDNTPKPLISVGNKPILETILENFIEYGFRDFYLSVYYKDKMIRDYFGDGSRWNVRIRYLKEETKLGTAGGLTLLRKKPSKTFFVMNGDLLTKVNFDQLLHFHKDNRGLATMCVREYDLQVPYGVVKTDRHHVLGIDEKPVQRFFVNAGIYALEPEALKYVPKNKPYDMPQLFERLIQEGKSASAFPIREYWLDIGRLDDLERANGEFSKVFNRR